MAAITCWFPVCPVQKAFIVILFFFVSCTREQPVPEMKLIQSFNCIEDYPDDIYFSYGDINLVSSPTGAYREAEAMPLSRFGYRFQVKNLGKPHLAVVRYPDDKRRFMCMMDGTSYDMTMGVFTGVDQPLTHQMQEIRRIFWPRWTDCSIVFMTWGNGEPAAVADIEIYELDRLLPQKMADKKRFPTREFGLQFEDPCGTCASLGALTEQEWLDRTISYMHHTGQNLLAYPIVWYHGPFYPSDREPAGYFGWVAARDRKIYNRWTSRPEDWVSLILKWFEKEGLEFQAVLTPLRLGSLMQDMNIHLDSIKSGKDTYNNMLWNDQVQSSTRDWTMEYNVINFKKKTNNTLNEWAYGERGGTFGKGPMFNPLHPTVQKALLGMIQEIAGRYGKSPAFKGISINMWHATIAWFFSLRSGYDDYTIGLFEKETGIDVPVDQKAPDRFSKRYTFLTRQYSEEWIAWRCEKIRELFVRMRDLMVAVRPDLRLTVTLWTETTIPGWLGMPGKPEHNLFARKSLYELCREGGFDLALYNDIPGIEIDYSMVPSRDRDGWGTSGADLPLEKTCSFRDHDFLDATTLEVLRKQEKPGVFIFDSWVEAWGKYEWFPCSPDDRQVKDLSVIWGKSVEGISRANAEYPEDNFWWDSQLRITPHFQGGGHYLEHFAHALAELDALRITRGGLFTDTGHTEELQRFAKAYRVLPQQKFETVGATTDPVAVRTLVHEGKRYFYLVNREYYPVKALVRFSNKPSGFTDLVNDRKLNVPPIWDITLEPYQVRSFSMSPGTTINSFGTTIPLEVIAELEGKAEKMVSTITALQNRNIELPTGAEKLSGDIKKALQEGRYAWVRRALNSYPARKAEQLFNSL
ncbi:family 10 glycosylhydrolase [Gaoshiqia sp. Z1-71]|uniref:family 10 glycosylhydrolase n=1 Tax=Gaoshiqia hydrogeniformans TaxID=3290090 RepID=UPI003BF77C6E